jgi:tetratricopeptide (TPR) repeat protein
MVPGINKKTRVLAVSFLLRRCRPLLGCGLAVIAAFLWFWWRCAFSGSVSFLAHHAPAEWVVYPKPAVAQLQGKTSVSAAPEMSAMFRRSFTLPQATATALLSIRAARRCTLAVNGQSVALPEARPNWKAAIQLDVAPWLKPGENSLALVVFNEEGPPALWLSLQSAGLAVNSDSNWEVSWQGAAWRPARSASEPQPIGRGSSLDEAERTLSSFVNRWAFLSVLAILAMGIILGARCWFKHADQACISARWRWAADPAKVLFAALVCLWIVLFTHNLSLLPRNVGFDRDGHWDYISFIQEHGTLPSPNQGWEMHQPPLYYVLAATLLRCLHLPASGFQALVVLRLFSLLIGLAQLTFIFLSLRLLFAGQTARQVVGLALAGFMPMQLALTHYVTNETLAACLMTATVYLVLKMFPPARAGGDAPISWRLAAALGCCLGLSLLTKVTAFVLVPLVAAALTFLVATSAGSLWRRWSPALLSAFVCVATCGWHYGRVWRSSRTLFPGDPTFHGWLDPSYLTASYFFRFGHSLLAPFFGGFSSFGDGIYSTMWGDGMWGGTPASLYRPPWNYELMAAGFLLALVPTALILIGLLVAAAKAIRQSEPRWWFLLAFSFALAMALLHQTLLSPNFATVKAFYGLSGLLALCGFAGVAFDFLARHARRVAVVAALPLVVWALNTYASFWIRGDSPDTQALLAHALFKAKNFPGALEHLRRSLEKEPENSRARTFLFATLLEQGRLPEATALVTRWVETKATSPQALLDLAFACEMEGRLREALELNRRAAGLAPDDAIAWFQLASRHFQARSYAEAIAAGREVLRISPMDAQAHLLLGASLWARAAEPQAALTIPEQEPVPFGLNNSASASDLLSAQAINHLRFGLRLAPKSPESLNTLAWILATHPSPTLRNGEEAATLAQRACILTGNTNPVMLATFAAACAETRRFDAALEAAGKAGSLLAGADDVALRQRHQRLLECLRLQQPYHEGVSVTAN